MSIGYQKEDTLNQMVWRCQAQKCWGASFGILKTKNCALLAKWWWKFGEERGTLWRGFLWQNMGMMSGVGFQAWSKGIRCQVCRVRFWRWGMSPKFGARSWGGEWLLKLGRNKDKFWVNDYLGAVPLVHLFLHCDFIYSLWWLPS